MEDLTYDLIKLLIETVLISLIIGAYITKRDERIKKTIEAEFNKRESFFSARFNFKLRALEELLAPLKLQLIRSKIGLGAYGAKNTFREKILKECNENARNLLLQKGHLIPTDLMPYAEKLISHYDGWLQAYYEERELKNDSGKGHVFTFNFPHEAEEKFLEKFDAYRKELEIEGSLN